ncbi:methionine adenosyltransferase [Flaviflexus salsibiostraticola]|uniref:S-adenosylmethionine synthase n=1 Tax=Flaviflexus salsibiostraticola TaxID=1282737 RepID=A0A3Q8WU64_9ACTO|nr:methionine adenosyltransferase [Flaviflexus salsibiostraticola]AZN29274.1 methionine adenosyltransferase [Flaviflexus salsibiostraticola]
MSTVQPFTSESVTAGHPDKVCDLISDRILDAIIAKDPDARVAIETMVTTGLVHVAGELNTTSYVEIPQIVREALLDLGYNSSEVGFDGRSCGVSVSIGQQSPDIYDGVHTSLEARQSTNEVDKYSREGAGDQGLMFGYATNETDVLMPMPIFLAHRLAETLTAVRQDGTVRGLRPDGKTQVTINYDESDKPVSVDTVVVSSQHDENVTQEELHREITAHVITPVLDRYAPNLDRTGMKILVNPSGRFVIGGPMSDAGLTGRKIIVDTYGGMARHGGGAFSGKDPSKVDRSATYAARWVAKNIVAAGLAERCEVQVAYAIGQAHPVSVRVDTFGTNTVPVEKITKAVDKVFDLKPLAIIDQLRLKRPIYAQTSSYGHFGRELPDFTWEQTDRVEALRSAIESL